MKMQENTEYSLLDIMPKTKWLKNQWWHRLFLVLWAISFLPLLTYFVFVLGDDFDFAFFDFAGFLLFGYLTIPVIYRIFLFILIGDYKKKE